MMLSKLYKTILKLLYHDIKVGVLQQYAKWIIFSLLILIICFTFTGQINLVEPDVKPSIYDTYIYLFSGIDVYHPNDSTIFTIPINWLTIHAFMGLMIVGFMSKDLSGNGIYYFINSGKRTNWWLSKCIWNLFVVVLFFSQIFILLTIFCAINGQVNLASTPLIADKVSGISVDELLENTKPAIIIFPIIIAISISMLQMTLELYIGPIWSYATVIILYVVTSYIYVPCFIANASMTKRILTTSGTAFGTALCVSIHVIIILLSYTAGYKKIQSVNVLG